MIKTQALLSLVASGYFGEICFIKIIFEVCHDKTGHNILYFVIKYLYPYERG